MVRHGGSSAGSYLADPTSPIPSHCVSIVLNLTTACSNTTAHCCHKTKKTGTKISGGTYSINKTPVFVTLKQKSESNDTVETMMLPFFCFRITGTVVKIDTYSEEPVPPAASASSSNCNSPQSDKENKGKGPTAPASGHLQNHWRISIASNWTVKRRLLVVYQQKICSKFSTKDVMFCLRILLLACHIVMLVFSKIGLVFVLNPIQVNLIEIPEQQKLILAWYAVDGFTQAE